MERLFCLSPSVQCWRLVLYGTVYSVCFDKLMMILKGIINKYLYLFKVSIGKMKSGKVFLIFKLLSSVQSQRSLFKGKKSVANPTCWKISCPNQLTWLGLHIRSVYFSRRYLIQCYLTADILQGRLYQCKINYSIGGVFESISVSFSLPHLSILWTNLSGKTRKKKIRKKWKRATIWESIEERRFYLW